jgi:hypothetical protein
MAKFVEIGDALLNLDMIRKITRGKDRTIVVTYREGGTESFRWEDYERITEQLICTVIPAQPGFELLVWVDGESEEFWFYRMAIIAWRTGLTYVTPVTVDDDEHNRNPQAILEPNGRVVIQAEASFNSLEEWEKDARKHWGDARARWLKEQETAKIARS